jgi:lysophospholipase L1-like esterase
LRRATQTDRAGLLRRLAPPCLIVCGLALASHGYVANLDASFFAGLALLCVGLGLASGRAQRADALIRTLALRTALLLSIGIAGLEPALRWRARQEAARPIVPAYSFQAAHADPVAFRRWAEAYRKEWSRTFPLYLHPDPRGINPMVTIPGARFHFFEGPHQINQLGFRGPEIELAKGNHYRIVALGESTTFGATIAANDRPWPEVLEERIARELRCDRPVQVVNAGMPGWTLANQLARLDSDIWPLEPDLLLTYHGYNGFPYLVRDIPEIRVGAAPSAPERPSRLLRGLEDSVRIHWFMRRYRAARDVDERILESDLHSSHYAELYRKLIFAARATGVDLVLATYNLAVTSGSPDEVVRFYELMFPDIRARVLANRLHTRLVRETGAEYGVPVIDTSSELEGAWQDAFLDPMHLTQVGRERLARNLFEGLRDVLREGAGCVPRSADARAEPIPADPPRP